VLKITRIVCEKANDFRHHVTRNVTPFTMCLAKDPDRRVLALASTRIDGEIDSARRYPVIAHEISTTASRVAREHRHWHTPCSP